MLNKILKIVFSVLPIVVGVFLIITGAGKIANKDLYDTAATAVITSIEREWTGTDADGFDEYDYHVYVEYEVNGKKYENIEYPGYSSSMKNGDEIDILYQSENPEKISETNIVGHSIIFIVIGAVLTLISIVAIIRLFLRGF